MKMNENRIHQIFQASILMKGAHAAVECLGGIALALVSTKAIRNVVNLLTQDELVEDPRDFVATHLIAFAQHFSVDTKNFFVFYLLAHGAIKLVLVVALLRDKLWSYPASLTVLGLFIVYQVYRFAYTQSAGLIILTVFDLVVMGLIWHEYNLMRHHMSRS